MQMSQIKNNITTKSLQHSTNTNNISDSINTKEQPAPPAASAGLKSNNTQMGMAKTLSTQSSRLRNTLDPLPIFNDNIENSLVNTTTPTKQSHDSNKGVFLNVKSRTTNKRPRSPEEFEQESLRKKTRTITQQYNETMPALERIPHSSDEIMEKEQEEINLQNIWKYDQKTRRDFLCSSFPTILITKIISKILKTASAVKKFLGLKYTSFLAKNIVAHTFSANRRTIYVHFSEQVQGQDLEEFVNTFNRQYIQQPDDKEMEEKEEKVNNKQKPQHICQLFQKDYVALQKSKRQAEVLNTETNHQVILKSVPLREANEDIKEILEEYGYHVKEILRFKSLPIVKVTLSSSEEVRKILEATDIQIGYSTVKVEMFDKYKSRPISHFKQCKKCFKLNHIAKECPSKNNDANSVALLTMEKINVYTEIIQEIIDVYYVKVTIQAILFYVLLFNQSEINFESILLKKKK
jgi:hypothetical protein